MNEAASIRMGLPRADKDPHRVCDPQKETGSPPQSHSRSDTAAKRNELTIRAGLLFTYQFAFVSLSFGLPSGILSSDWRLGSTLRTDDSVQTP
jgi:hypothetical protein